MASKVKTFLEEVKAVKGAIGLVFGIAVVAWVAGMSSSRWVNVPEMQVQQERSISRLDSLVTVMSAHLVSHSDEISQLRAEQDSAWSALQSLARSVDRFSVAACMVVEGMPELQCRRRLEREQ